MASLASGVGVRTARALLSGTVPLSVIAHGPSARLLVVARCVGHLDPVVVGNPIAQSLAIAGCPIRLGRRGFVTENMVILHGAVTRSWLTLPCPITAARPLADAATRVIGHLYELAVVHQPIEGVAIAGFRWGTIHSTGSRRMVVSAIVGV
jgi:hypothetical protein